MQIGIRAHDTAAESFEEMVIKVREQGFTCIHVALSKSIPDFDPKPQALTPGLAMYLKRQCEAQGLDIAVLGNYLNLCDPDEERYKKSLDKYIAHLRFSRWLGAGVVGTETGAVNPEYRYEPENHSEKALSLFTERLRPVVEAAEKLGAFIAVEPVWRHIVCSPERARRVLDEIGSPNLRIIFDPVNLLCVENAGDQDRIIRDSFELLGPAIDVIHLKDFKIQNGELVSVASGEGELDYELLMSEIRRCKPFVQCTLEDTRPDNALRAREFVEKAFKK